VSYARQVIFTTDRLSITSTGRTCLRKLAQLASSLAGKVGIGVRCCLRPRHTCQRWRPTLLSGRVGSCGPTRRLDSRKKSNERARTFIHRYSFTFVIVKYYILFVILYRLSAHSDGPSDVGRLNLLHSLWWYMGHKSLRRQPSADSSATSAGHTRWSGVRCRRSVDVELTTETSTRPFLQHFCF